VHHLLIQIAGAAGLHPRVRVRRKSYWALLPGGLVFRDRIRAGLVMGLRRAGRYVRDMRYVVDSANVFCSG
jgi:hypothetical protein